MALRYNNTTVPTNGEVRYNNTSLQSVRHNNVEVWKKAVQVANLVANSGFTAGTANWSMKGNYSISYSGGSGGSWAYLNSWYSTEQGQATQSFTLTAGHIYYLRASGMCTSSQENIRLRNSSWSVLQRLSFGSGWSTQNMRYTPSATETYYLHAGNNVAHAGHTAGTTSILFVDLTASFGAGKEPAQATCNGWSWWDGRTDITI